MKNHVNYKLKKNLIIKKVFCRGEIVMPEMRIEKYGTYKTKNHNLLFYFPKINESCYSDDDIRENVTLRHF